MIRKKCKIKGCHRLGRFKGVVNGHKKWGNICSYHHKGGLERLINKPYSMYKGHIPNDKCELCGWDKAPCDRHRKEPMRGYVKENVVVLCPNCHRLVTMGFIVLL